MVRTIDGGLLALAGTALIAHSDIIPSFDSIVPSGGNFQFNYTATVTGDQRVETGDFFTIYDFITGSCRIRPQCQPIGLSLRCSSV
jgi:hypothetical protein